MNQASNIKIQIAAIICLAAIIFAAGCAKTIRIRAVDAVTGKPLPGVSTSVTQYRADMLHPAGSEGPAQLSPSDTNGVIIARGFHKSWWLGQFVFSSPGYSNSYGEYQNHDFRFATGTNAFFPELPFATPFGGAFGLQNPARSQFTNGCFLIPLRPKP